MRRAVAAARAATTVLSAAVLVGSGLAYATVDSPHNPPIIETRSR